MPCKKSIYYFIQGKKHTKKEKKKRNFIINYHRLESELTKVLEYVSARFLDLSLLA